MLFKDPQYLWYLLAVPVAIATHFLLVQRARYKALLFSNYEALKKLRQQGKVSRNIGLLFVRVLLLSAIIIALAHPVVKYKGKVHNSDFVIAIDASASMMTEDYYPNRLEAAKQSAQEFVDTLDSESEISVIAFSGVPFIVQEPTTNKDDVIKAINSIKAIPSGGTDIPSAIITAVNLLSNVNKGRVLILASDGSNTVTPLMFDPVQKSIDYAKEHNLLIYTIGIGTETGPIGYLPKYYNVSGVYNERVLIRISNSTSGDHFRAADTETIKAAFKKIASRSKQGILEKNLSELVLIIALLSLAFEWGLASTKYRRIP